MKHSLQIVALGLLVMSLGACRESKIDTGSMEPSIKKGEDVTINFMAYVSSQPARWDVVAYKNEHTNGHTWCHRLVGLGGETIDIRDGFVFINGTKLEYPAKLGSVRYAPTSGGEPGAVRFPYTVPAGTYFVLGDNTNDAYDSRYIGTVSESDIKGRVEGK